MSSNVLAIVLANALMLALGAGLLPLLRVALTPRELAVQLPLAYAAGIAGTGILASELALVHVPVGKIGLPLLALATLALGLWRLERGAPGGARRAGGSRSGRCPRSARSAVALVYLGNAARLFAVKPLIENDGWALWGVRAQALFDAGHPFAPVFTEAPYPALSYPLFLPSLEAIDARFMSTFDATAIHVQLLGLAVAFVGGGLGAAAAVRAVAPARAGAAGTADRAGLLRPAADEQRGRAARDGDRARRGGARGLDPDRRARPPPRRHAVPDGRRDDEERGRAVRPLRVPGRAGRDAARAAAAAARRRRGMWVALILPWHLWLLAHHVTGTTWKLSHLLHPGYLADNAHRVSSAARQLLDQIWLASSWSRLPWLVVAGVVLALLLRRLRATSFAVAWLLLSFGGLLLVYWSSPLTLEDNLYNSADRTIDTLVIAGVLLVPVLLAIERDPPEP